MLTARIALLILSVVTPLIALAPKTSYATPEEYDYTYNLTNLYANYSLVYLFTNLTADTEYVWQIQRVGLDGKPLEVWGRITRTPDSTTSGFLFTNFPNIDTPFRVTDNFGRILGRHFLSHDISTSAYWNTAGSNELTDRTEIRKLGADFSPDLVDNNGEAIDGLACCNDTMGVQPNSEYVVNRGDYLLVHYNIDPSVTESSFNIRSLTSADLTFTTNMLEVVDYNLGDGYAFSVGLEYKDFIVLSTVGAQTNGYVSIGGCPFCDPILAVEKFPTSSIPMYADLSDDFYECARINDASSSPVTYPCEYMIGVNPSTSPMGMSIPRSFSTVRLGKPVQLRFSLSDSTIWNALNSQDFFLTVGASADGIPELITALESSPFTSQTINITPTNAIDNVNAYWVMCPATQFYQSAWLLCLSSIDDFSVRDSTSVSLSESINDGLLPQFGFDNEFSHIFLAILFYIGSFVIIAFLTRATGHAPKQLYDFAFIGISVLLVIIGWFQVWTAVIVLILCVLALMHAIKGGEASNDA